LLSPWNAASNRRGEKHYSVLDFVTSRAFVGTNPTGELIGSSGTLRFKDVYIGMSSARWFERLIH